MSRQTKKNKFNKYVDSDFFFSDEKFKTLSENKKKMRNKKDVGKRFHRKRTLKDDFWDNY